MITRSDAGKWVHTLRTEPKSARRRVAVVKLAESRYADEGSTVTALCDAARFDPSVAVRLEATRALGVVQSSDAVPTLLALLGDETLLREQEPQAQGLNGEEERALVQPADPELRFEASVAMESLVRGDLLSPPQRRAALELAINLLRTDRARDVRMEAARILGHLPRREALENLVAALQQDDFGVVYESERSLMRLTGQSLGHDPGQWSRWLAETEDPFHDRGNLDRRLVDEEPRPWWRFWR